MRIIEFEVRNQDNNILGYERINEDGQWQRSFSSDFTDCLDGVIESYLLLKRRQFTGLTDKNGNKIFEHDILDCGKYHGISQVIWLNGSWKVQGRFSKVGIGSWAKHTTLLGNFFDNPEILQSEK